MFPLLLLPVELIVHVCSFLVRRDVDKVQQTCRRLRKIVKRHNVVLPVERLCLNLLVRFDTTIDYEIEPLGVLAEKILLNGSFRAMGLT